MNIAGWVDTLPCAAAYHTKFKAQFKMGEEGSGLSWFEPGSAEWKSARNLRARVQGLLKLETDERNPRVFALEPGHALPWEREEEAEGWDRFIVALAAGPGVHIHAGPATATFVVGQVLQFNPLTLHTIANFGPVPLVALTVDLRNVALRDLA